jgi:YD repeat-containing protein
MGTSADGGSADTNGTVEYLYDPAGNLVQRRDPRNSVTDILYDLRSRVQLKAFSGGPQTTPDVTYCYDGIAASGPCAGAPVDPDSVNRPWNLRGKLTMVKNADSTTKYIEYDGLGRVMKSSQTTAGLGKQMFRYGFNHLALEAIQYPSGRVVRYGFDAAGQVSSVTGSPDTEPRTYVASAQYAAHGAVERMTLQAASGTDQRFEATCYNDRLQPATMLLRSSVPVQANCGDTLNNWVRLVLGYGSAGANNGNVRSQSIRPSAGATITQAYDYDKLNRLKVFRENSVPLQTFDYDRWGSVCAVYADLRWGESRAGGDERVERIGVVPV